MSAITELPEPELLDGKVQAPPASAPLAFDAARVTPTRMKRAFYIVGGATALLALIGTVGASSSPQQFAFSYLTAFVFAVSIAIGSLFWVFIHHLTSAGWSVVVRRQFENLTMCLPALALLFVPIALNLTSLYAWLDVAANGSDPLWQAKRGYLNAPWFIVRAGLYLLCWTGLALCMRSWSVSQDQSGDAAFSRKMKNMSAWGMALLALTSTYAAFDWLMSLDYHWYSTMYGVYFWAGSIVGSLAALTLMVVILRSVGLLRDAITEEHLHDLGKLLFAFTIFWAYIAFSQYLLIWYANLTEETPWYLVRLQGNWRGVTIVLMLGHFIVPFAVLMSRRAKRSGIILGLVAVWLFGFHYLDLYWQVMPNLNESDAKPHWLDMVWLFVLIGIIVLGLLFGMKTSALVPLRDPRLSESLRFHQE